MPVLRTEREELRTLVNEYWNEQFSGDGSMRDALVRIRRFDHEYLTETPFRCVWWAKVNDAPIGFAKTELVEDPVWGTQGDISEFYIAPAFRRHGHGKALAQWLLAWFSEHGVRSVRLFVRLDNPGALAFWTNLGFENVQTWHQMRNTVIR